MNQYIKMKGIIIGAGTYGETYLDFLREVGVEIVGFLDDNPELTGKKIRGAEVLGTTELLPSLKERYGVEAVYCPIGSNKIRVNKLETARACGYKTPNFIHPKANIAPTVSMADEGVYIEGSTNIMSYVVIERDVLICTGGNVAHHCYLSQGTFISMGVNFGAMISTGKFAYMGIGSTIMSGVKSIGEDALVGAGSVVIRDVPDRAVVIGVPARILKVKED